jgi:hypothetical protein
MKRIAPAALAAAALAVVAASVVVAACSDQPIKSCRNIPAGGCPLAGGAECQDPSCTAAYACDSVDGTWVFDHACPARDGGGADADADAALGDAGASDADIDAPPGAFGGPGCISLQPPDCPLGTALVCGGGSCCGCQDLYVCNDGGWDLWGSCGDAGIVPQ